MERVGHCSESFFGINLVSSVLSSCSNDVLVSWSDSGCSKNFGTIVAADVDVGGETRNGDNGVLERDEADRDV